MAIEVSDQGGRMAKLEALMGRQEELSQARDTNMQALIKSKL